MNTDATTNPAAPGGGEEQSIAKELLTALVNLEEAARCVQTEDWDRNSIDVERRAAQALIKKANALLAAPTVEPVLHIVPASDAPRPTLRPALSPTLTHLRSPVRAAQ